MDDTGLQSALNQLPQDLEQPVTPPAPTVPPVEPPAPPPPPATPPAPPVPPEQPTIQKPPSKLARNVKKNGLKIAGGALMFMLLVGGAWFGVNEVQNRQAAESQACGASGGDWDEHTGECGHHSPSPSPHHSPSPSPSPLVSPSPSLSPSPSPSPTPSPSPSPSLSLSCVDLISDKITPALDDSVEFTCKASFSAITPVAFFRHNVDGGSFITSNAVSFSGGNTEVPYSIEIDELGDWLVQCRVCTDNSATTCTAWGQAQ